MNATGLRVVKVGGSLFDWPQLPAALQQWFNGQPPARNVLIAGGGDLADAIRGYDQRFGLDATEAHWLCIDAMRIKSRVLHRLLPAARWADTWGRVSSVSAELSGAARAGPAAHPTCVVFDPRDWLLNDEPHQAGLPLPHDWDVTSDSIAARLAQVLDAQELVLLKSTTVPAGCSLTDLSARGVVDRFLPNFGRVLTALQFVNLRADEAPPIE